MKRLIAARAAADARRGHPGAAEPGRLVAGAGAAGRHRPWRAVAPTATTSRPSTRSPRPTRCASGCQADGFALTERLCVYPQYIDPEWVSQGVLDTIKLALLELHPAPRLGRAPSRPRRSARTSSRARSTSARDGARAQRGGADGAVRGDPPGGDRGDAPGRRRAAGRARRRHRDVRRQPQHQRLQRLHRSAVPSAASVRASARRTPTSTTDEEFVRRVREAVEYGATEICIQSGIHPDWGLEDYVQLAAGGQAQPRRSSTCTRTARWRSPTCATSPGSARGGVRASARGRSRLDARHGRGGPARRRARTDQPEQAPGRALGRDHRGVARAPGCAPPRR